MAGDRLDDLMLRVKAIQGRVAAAPALRWGTVTATSPLSVILDGSPSALVGVSNAGPRALVVGQRVRVDVQGTRVTVVSAARDDLRGTSAERVALGSSGVMQEGMRFFDTSQNLDYVWRNGEWVPKGKLLWEGAWYMNASQTAMLSELVSEQENGIILCFSEYSTVAHNYNWHYFSVPKAHVSRSNAQGVNCITSVGGTPTMSRKYVYVHNDRITGQAANANAPNNNHVLREVRGY